MGYKIYILKSKTTDRYYIGSTEDLEKRIELHNGPHAKWTKRYQPWVLIHFEEFNTRSEVVKRERFLKSLKNIKKFLENNNSVG